MAGTLLIEVGSKEERERISNRITEKCGEELEAKVQERRNPRLVIYNIPEEVTHESGLGHTAGRGRPTS